jgi:hypothetical protein
MFQASGSGIAPRAERRFSNKNAQLAIVVRINATIQAKSPTHG